MGCVAPALGFKREQLSPQQHWHGCGQRGVSPASKKTFSRVKYLVDAQGLSDLSQGGKAMRRTLIAVLLAGAVAVSATKPAEARWGWGGWGWGIGAFAVGALLGAALWRPAYGYGYGYPAYGYGYASPAYGYGYPYGYGGYSRAYYGAYAYQPSRRVRRAVYRYR
jgi:hypothetical protein